MTTLAFRSPHQGDKPVSWRLRPASVTDIDAIAHMEIRDPAFGAAELSERIDFWRKMFARFGSGRPGRHFLTGVCDGCVIGYAMGEVRAWEFNAEPCGWLVGLYVDRQYRQNGLGEALFNALSVRFKGDMAHCMRVMAPRLDSDSHGLMAFLRRQGMKTASHLPFERPI